MSPAEFLAAIHALGFSSPYAAGRAGVLGLGVRQLTNYASGVTPVPEAVARLLRAYLDHGLPQPARARRAHIIPSLRSP